MNRKYEWCDSSGLLNLTLTQAETERGYHGGSCDADVLALSKEAHISAQLGLMQPGHVRIMLREYGAWDENELMFNHDQNLQRVLWLACADCCNDIDGELISGKGE